MKEKHTVYFDRQASDRCLISIFRIFESFFNHEDIDLIVLNSRKNQIKMYSNVIYIYKFIYDSLFEKQIVIYM